MCPSEITFEYVKPITSHAKVVMAWQNDPESLSMSFNQKTRTWIDFFDEFLKTYFQYPVLPPLFVLVDGERTGFLCFQPVSHPTTPLRKCCDISLHIAPESRSKNIETVILKEVQKFLKLHGMDDVIAELREKNQISQKAFEQAGFIFFEDADKIIKDTGELCHIRRYMAKLTSINLNNKGVFIIAEAGSNWRMGTPERDMAMAKTLIDVAAEAGVDAVKFQTYLPQTVYVENAGNNYYLSGSGIKNPTHDILADSTLPYAMIPVLAQYCNEKGLQFMSTPCSAKDFNAVDPYVLIHKIASYEITHVRLLEMAARSGKPLILSTGASQIDDIAWAVATFHAAGGTNICLTQCTAKYPAPLNSMNLNVIPWLKQYFGVSVGLSDHSRHPTYAPIAAIALGASVIEKYYTLDNRLPGPDHGFSVLPHELKEMVQAVRNAEQMLGNGVKTIHPIEAELHQYARRGVQAIKPIATGEILQEGQNIDILRPGKRTLGLHPKNLLLIEGKAAKRSISTGEGIQQGDWDD